MNKLSNEQMSTFSGGSCTFQEYWEWVNNPPWWIWIIPGAGPALWSVIVRQDMCGGTIIFPLGTGGDGVVSPPHYL